MVVRSARRVRVRVLGGLVAIGTAASLTAIATLVLGSPQLAADGPSSPESGTSRADMTASQPSSAHLRGHGDDPFAGHPALDAEGRRNPALWPYPKRSIWNMPLGDRARLVPLNLTKPTQVTLAAEEDIIINTPDAPPRNIFYSPAGWHGGDRCAGRTSRVLLGSQPVPHDFYTDPGFVGRTPNHSTAIVHADGTLTETQPFHACSDGYLVSKTAPKAWQGGSIISGGTATKVGRGSHGGSGLTAFGGTIRLGEWVPGGVIPHVVKIEISAAKYLSTASGGFRWPASNADRRFAGIYGGPDQAARMGALLALPRDVNIKRFKSPAAKILARTLRDYGAYIVDDAARDTVAFATEWGPAGRVLDEFQQTWGFPLAGDVSKSTGDQQLFLKSMVKIFKRLAVVDDNSPAHVGGHGARVTDLAPGLSR